VPTCKKLIALPSRKIPRGCNFRRCLSLPTWVQREPIRLARLSLLRAGLRRHQLLASQNIVAKNLKHLLAPHPHFQSHHPPADIGLILAALPAVFVIGWPSPWRRSLLRMRTPPHKVVCKTLAYQLLLMSPRAFQLFPLPHFPVFGKASGLRANPRSRYSC